MKHLTDEEIQDYLDNNSSDSEYISKHIDICTNCKKSINRYKMIYSELSNEKGFELPLDFTQKLISKIKAEYYYKKSSKFKYIFAVCIGFILTVFSTLCFTGIQWIENLGIEKFITGYKIDISGFEILKTVIQSIDLNIGLLFFGTIVLIVTAFLDSLLLKPIFRKVKI